MRRTRRSAHRQDQHCLELPGRKPSEWSHDDGGRQGLRSSGSDQEVPYGAFGSGTLLKRAHPPSGDQRKPSPESQVLIVQTWVMPAGRSGGIIGSGASGAVRRSLTAKGTDGKLVTMTKICRSSTSVLTSLRTLSARFGSASHSLSHSASGLPVGGGYPPIWSGGPPGA